MGGQECPVKSETSRLRECPVLPDPLSARALPFPALSPTPVSRQNGWRFVSVGGRLYQGRTRAQAPMVDEVTYVQASQKLSPGELVRCVVVESDGYDLIAKPVEEMERRTRLQVVGVR